MRSNFSYFAYLLCCALIIATAIWYPKWEKQRTEATLSWDVMGYYLYLPAAIIYKDIKSLSFKDKIIEQYQPTGSFYQAFSHKNGNYVMKYPIGLAVLYLPFFLIAHLFALNSDYPADGFSLPYQIGISWGSILIAFWGLWVMRSVLLQYFSEKAVGAGLILVVFATNYLNYTAIDGSMSHNWVFTILAILIGQTISWYRQANIKNSFLIGICIGLAALSRPTDILICLVPVSWGLTSAYNLKERFLFLKQQLSYLLIILFTVVLIGSIQLFYWKYVSGDWLVYSYEDQGFSWLRPHIKDVLFSYRKGWLIYTPIMLLALIGLVPLYRNYRFLFWGVVFYFGLHFYITAAWDIWWYGGSFGQRALIQAYPILLFPLAAFIESHLINTKNISNSVNKAKSVNNSVDKLGNVDKPYLNPLAKRVVFFLFSIFCIWLNCFQTYQAHGHGFEVDAMTKSYYWRIFGNTSPTDLDKKLLDTKEDYQGVRKNIEAIYFNDFEKDSNSQALSTQQAYSGKRALLMNAENAYSPEINIPLSAANNKRIRVQAQFYTPQKEWEIWQMTQLIVQFKKGEEITKKRMIRVQRQIGENAWQANWTDINISKGDFDAIGIVFWNAGSKKPLFIDDLLVERYEEGDKSTPI